MGSKDGGADTDKTDHGKQPGKRRNRTGRITEGKREVRTGKTDGSGTDGPPDGKDNQEAEGQMEKTTRGSGSTRSTREAEVRTGRSTVRKVRAKRQPGSGSQTGKTSGKRKCGRQ